MVVEAKSVCWVAGKVMRSSGGQENQDLRENENDDDVVPRQSPDKGSRRVHYARKRRQMGNA